MSKKRVNEIQKEISRLAGQLMLKVKTQKLVDYPCLDQICLLFDELSFELKEEKEISKLFVGRILFCYGVMGHQAKYAKNGSEILEASITFLFQLRKVCPYLFMAD